MNYGKRITKAVLVNFSEGMKIINTLKANGQVFRVDFNKRSDGSTRTMVCRFGVSKGVTGKGSAYSFTEKDLLCVWEFATGYRTIPIDKILGIKHGGVWYSFININSIKSETFNVVARRKNRTIPAYTSPLLG